MEKVCLDAEYLFEFESFQRWVNKAQSWFKGYNMRMGNIICIDKNYNVCACGEDFMLARDLNLFPVKVYELKRTKDVNSPEKSSL